MRNWKVIKTKAEYKLAIQRTVDLFEKEENAEEPDKLELLLVSYGTTIEKLF